MDESRDPPLSLSLSSVVPCVLTRDVGLNGTANATRSTASARTSVRNLQLVEEQQIARRRAILGDQPLAELVDLRSAQWQRRGHTEVVPEAAASPGASAPRG